MRGTEQHRTAAGCAADGKPSRFLSRDCAPRRAATEPTCFQHQLNPLCADDSGIHRHSTACRAREADDDGVRIGDRCRAAERHAQRARGRNHQIDAQGVTAIDHDLARCRFNAERVDHRVEEPEQVPAGAQAIEAESAERIADGGGGRIGETIGVHELYDRAGEWGTGKTVKDNAADRAASRCARSLAVRHAADEQSRECGTQTVHDAM